MVLGHSFVCIQLLQWKVLVFLDGDLVLTGNVDHMFNLPEVCPRELMGQGSFVVLLLPAHRRLGRCWAGDSATVSNQAPTGQPAPAVHRVKIGFFTGGGGGGRPIDSRPDGPTPLKASSHRRKSRARGGGFVSSAHGAFCPAASKYHWSR